MTNKLISVFLKVKKEITAKNLIPALIALYFIFTMVDFACGFILTIIRNIILLIIIITSIKLENQKIIFEKKVIFSWETILFIIYFLYYALYSKIFNQFIYLKYINYNFSIILMLIILINKRYSKQDIKRMLNIITIGISIVSLIFIVFNLSNNNRGIIKFFGLVTDPNYVSSNLMLPIIFCLSTLFDKAYSIKKKALYIMCLIVMLFLLVLMASRGIILSTLFGLGILVIYYGFNKKNYKKLLMLFLLISATVLSCVIILPSETIERFNISSVIKGGGGARLRIWSKSIDTFFNEGLLHKAIGNGMGSFINTVNIIQYGDKMAAHNIFISTIIEGGVFALLLLCIIFIKLFLNSFKNKQYFIVAIFASTIISSMTLDFSGSFWNNIMIMFIILKSEEYFVKSRKVN